MFDYNKLLKRIKKNEGYSNVVYKDQLGNQTIGYGHLITSKDTFLKKVKYSKNTLSGIFSSDLDKAISDFKINFNYMVLPNNVQGVIIEMIFQLGIKKVLKFKKFNYCLQEKFFYLAALEMMKSKWYKQTPKRVNQLIEILLKK